MGLINLCDLRKAAELERNLKSVMQLQVQHEIEVAVYIPRICPHLTQLRTVPGISPDNAEFIPMRWVVSPGNCGGTVTLQVLSVAISQAFWLSQAWCFSFTKVLLKAWHHLKYSLVLNKGLWAMIVMAMLWSTPFAAGWSIQRTQTLFIYLQEGLLFVVAAIIQ